MTASDSNTTVIIPNWNGRSWLPECLASVCRQTLPPKEVIVVDNGSTDDSCDWLQANQPAVRIIRMGRNTGFAAAVNAGIRAADTPFIALLNNDTRIADHWLETLSAMMLEAGDSTVGAVCGKMLQMEKPDRIENAGDTLSWQGAAEKRGHNEPADSFNEPGEIFSVCAGGAIYRRTFLDAVGLFDERFFAYLEDIDLCLRGRLFGFRYLYEPRAVLWHHGHGSRIPSARYVRLTTANRLRLLAINLPRRLLLKHLHSILYGQWYFLVCNRRPVASLLGYFDFIAGLRYTLRERRSIKKSTRLNAEDLDRLLANRMQQPGILEALRRRFQNKGTGS